LIVPRRTLEAIQKKISALVSAAKRLKKERSPALRRIVSLARANSISIADIRDALAGGRKARTTPRKKKRRTSRKVAAMYRDPKTGNTWSGRGRPARWLAAAEKAGLKRSEFLIKKS
jgi:DNA-binding protein H-NS